MERFCIHRDSYASETNCGPPFQSPVLSYRGQGRPQNITPPPGRLEDVRRLTDAYRQFRLARTQLVRIQRQLLTLIDRIEAARIAQGEHQFQQIRPPTSRPRR